MKKASRSRRSASKKTTRTSKKGIQHVLLLPFSFRRIVLVTTCMALFVFALNVSGKNPGHQAVAGINITRGLFVQATVSLPQVENAVSYNIYYKKKNASEYKNAVRSISPDTTAYTISYLTKGATYVYKVAAVDASGAEFWFSEEKTLDNLQPM